MSKSNLLTVMVLLGLALVAFVSGSQIARGFANLAAPTQAVLLPEQIVCDAPCRQGQQTSQTFSLYNPTASAMDVKAVTVDSASGIAIDHLGNRLDTPFVVEPRAARTIGVRFESGQKEGLRRLGLHVRYGIGGREHTLTSEIFFSVVSSVVCLPNSVEIVRSPVGSTGEPSRQEIDVFEFANHHPRDFSAVRVSNPKLLDSSIRQISRLPSNGPTHILSLFRVDVHCIENADEEVSPSGEYVELIPTDLNLAPVRIPVGVSSPVPSFTVKPARVFAYGNATQERFTLRCRTRSWPIGELQILEAPAGVVVEEIERWGEQECLVHVVTERDFQDGEILFGRRGFSKPFGRAFVAHGHLNETRD